MNRFLVSVLFLLYLSPSYAQSSAFDYEDYFYYRNHQYLQTSSALLSSAAVKAMSGDTVAAVNLIQQAAEKGLYDTAFITGRKSLQFIRKHASWEKIRMIVAGNRLRYSDPNKIEISTDDVKNFWKVYPTLQRPDAESIIMSNYIMPGTQGLRTFFEVRMGLRAASLIQSVRNQYKYYESIRDVSLSLDHFRPVLRAAAARLKELYPSSIFPPTYFVMSNFQAFGTADGGAGQLIGAEFLCARHTADTSQLGNWERSNLTDTSRITGIFIHELVHIQQQTKPTSLLLGRSINEGAADFITQLILGYNINSKLHQYGDAHEKELWQKFSQQMAGDNVEDWLYNGFNEKRSFPADLGYYMGYKICESYYNKAADKKQAVKDIMEIQDYETFLERSGYAEKRKSDK